MWIAVWVALVGAVAALYWREQRRGRGVSYDTYASKGKADDEARMRAETEGPRGDLGAGF